MAAMSMYYWATVCLDVPEYDSREYVLLGHSRQIIVCFISATI